MSKISPVYALLVWLVSAVIVNAQPRLEVLSIEAPEWAWGNHAITLRINNVDDYVRFVVIKTTFESHGDDGVWQIQSRFTSYVRPEMVTTLAPVIPIPGNYGPATVNVTCYDVVDTMDVVLPDQEILDTTFRFAIEMPETVQKWVNQRVVLSPRLEQHTYFDDQFSRMALQFIAAGIPLEEMARITGCPPVYTRTMLSRMRRHDQARLGETAIELNFPYISGREAEVCLPLANKSASLLASTISENLTDYEGFLASLVKEGKIPDDRDNLISGAMLLYEPYIMVSAMLLWYDLGSRFVTDGKPLRIFEGSDVCNAANVDFIYAVEADDSLAGHHFFALLSRQDGDGILFADHVPNLECTGNYPIRPGTAAKADFAYAEDDRPEFFFLDTSIARPVLDGLGKGTELILNETHRELTDLAGQFPGRKELTTGYKYWFWNLVATKTLDLLTERQVLEGRGTNHFHLGSVTGM